MLLYGGGGGSWEGLFGTRVPWREAGVQGDDGFSLAELQGWLIPCGRCNVHRFCWGL